MIALSCDFFCGSASVRPFGLGASHVRAGTFSDNVDTILAMVAVNLESCIVSKSDRWRTSGKSKCATYEMLPSTGTHGSLCRPEIKRFH